MTDYIKKVEVEVVKSNDFELPRYHSEYDAGCDVQANLSNIENVESIGGAVSYNYVNEPYSPQIVLRPNTRAKIPTGLIISVPPGYEIEVRSRSGASYKIGLVVVNSPGTLDSSYKKEVFILVHNISNKEVCITHGDRIAQLVLKPVYHIKWAECLDTTYFTHKEDRQGGIGSSAGITE